jgi:hypothetical protein
MAKKPQEPKTTTTIEIDPQRLIEALQSAGLDLAKLNFREILGTHVDMDELQSHLNNPHVRVSIKTDNNRESTKES